jgi:hypothetical protein
MKTPVPPESVFALVDQVAAALPRDDPNFARELVDIARLRWVAEGRDQCRRELELARDFELDLKRRANVWFETKDGLTMLGEIDSNKYWPPIWKRACRPSRPPHAVSCDEVPCFDFIEVRTYARSSRRAEDGRPIYVEV